MKLFGGGRSKSGPVLTGGDATTVDHVTIPNGVRPGQKLRVEMPDGRAVTIVVPGDAFPGAVIEVERQLEIKVNVPKTAQVGDPLTVEHEGKTLAFTVPPGTKPGSRIKLSVPVSQLREHKTSSRADDDDVEVDTQKAVVPANWDGYSPISMDNGGKPLLFMPPIGSRPGDEVLLDIPSAGAKVRLVFTVPPGAYGGEVIGVTTPSGFVKFVTLPSDAIPGGELTVRVTDANDAG